MLTNIGTAETTGIKLLTSGDEVKPLTIHALEAKNNELPAWDETHSAGGTMPEVFIIWIGILLSYVIPTRLAVTLGTNSLYLPPLCINFCFPSLFICFFSLSSLIQNLDFTRDVFLALCCLLRPIEPDQPMMIPASSIFSYQNSLTFIVVTAHFIWMYFSCPTHIWIQANREAAKWFPVRDFRDYGYAWSSFPRIQATVYPKSLWAWRVLLRTLCNFYHRLLTIRIGIPIKV